MNPSAGSGAESNDILGLAGTYPRPGWVVIDAIRDSAFTGEVVCATTPAVTLHADRGHIYIVERASDPALGARLVAAGALTAADLDRGVVHLAGADHLGRLFERAPSVDRDAVLAANDLINDECLGWLAAQRVHAAEVTPYRHHSSGIHRWASHEPPVLPLPTFPAPPSGVPAASMRPPASAAVAMPAPTAAALPPPTVAAPAQLAAPIVAVPVEIVSIETVSAEHDDVIRWDEPAFLDQPLAGEIGLGLIKPLPTPARRPVDPAHTSLDPADEPLFSARFDWLDQLDTDGLPEPGSDPLARPVKLPPVAAEPIDRFEVIWPSGDVDEQFGGQPTDALPHPDIDRAGPTARLLRAGGSGRPRSATALKSSDQVDDAVADALGAGVDDIEVWLASETERDAQTDDVVLAVRRAVASIETGSLGSRERRNGPRGLTLGTLDQQLDMRSDHGSDTGIVPPGRIAVRVDTTGEVPLTATGRMSRPNPSAGSVFDEVAPALPPPTSKTDADEAEFGGERVSALRRLIGTLRPR